MTDEMIEQLRDRLDATEETPLPDHLVAAAMVDEVTDVICTLVRTICMGDKTLYRPLIETVAHRLGDV